MVDLFAAGKGKKNQSKTRKAMWFEYNSPFGKKKRTGSF